MFSVFDTGPGIPADKAAHLFDRFFRGTSGAPGLGLGLFITHHLVQAHGGRLWFEAAPSGGTVFRFTLARGS